MTRAKIECIALRIMEAMTPAMKELLRTIHSTLDTLESPSLWPDKPFIQVVKQDEEGLAAEVGVLIANERDNKVYPVVWDVTLEQTTSLPLTQWRVLHSYSSLRQLVNFGWRISK